MYKCYLCDKNFQSQCHLERHKNNKRICNKSKNLYNCGLCKINFKYESELERHNNSKKHIINLTNMDNKKEETIKEEKEETIKEKKEETSIKEENIINIRKEYEEYINSLKLEIELLKKKIKFQKLEKDNEIMNLKLENQSLRYDNNKDKKIIGSIYQIEYNQNSNIRYIGSTTKTLKNRYASHKTKYNKWLTNDDYAKCEIYEYFKIYGIENFKITLLKEYHILNKTHLLVYEQLWMNKLTNINKNKAFSPINIEYHKLKYESYI
jgi:hypothetical protein